MSDNSPNTEFSSEPTPGLKEAYRLVIQEVEQLRKVRHSLELKIQKAEAARDLLLQLLSSEDDLSEDYGPARDEAANGKKPTRHRKGSRTAEVIERSKMVLRSNGRPLERGELLEKIEATGFRVEGGNPARVIGRTLWESDEFIHIPKEGYWLKGEDVPSMQS